MNKKNIIKIIFGVIFSISLGAGITTGILLPKALKAKKGLENFLPHNNISDPYLSLKNKKIKYLALGDSLTAGYIGQLEKDSYSYSDFLANNLKKSDNLEWYKNLAKSGSTVFSLLSTIYRNSAWIHVIKNADLISLSVGANDLLAAGKALQMGLSLDREKIMDSLLGRDNANIDRSNLNINKGLVGPKIENIENEMSKSHVTISKGEQKYLIRKSLKQLSKMYLSKDFHTLISINPEFKNKIFQLIKRNLLILFRDILSINPNVKIILIVPPFPFAQVPDNLVNKKQKDKEFANSGMSLKGGFQKLTLVIKEATEFTLESNKNPNIDFINSKDLPIYKATKDGVILKGKKFSDYIKKMDDYNLPLFNAMKKISKDIFKKLEPLIKNRKKIKDEIKKLREIKSNYKEKIIKKEKELKEKNTEISKTFTNEKNKLIDDWFKQNKSKKYATKIKSILKSRLIPKYWINNAMPNIADIHPSIFGHQLIGNSLYSRIFPYLKNNNDDPIKHYSFAKPFSYEDQKGFVQLDNAPHLYNYDLQYSILRILKGKGNFLYSIIDFTKKFFKNNKIVYKTMNNIQKEIKNMKYDDFKHFFELLNNNEFIDYLLFLLDKKVNFVNMINAINDSWNADNKIEIGKLVSIMLPNLLEIDKYIKDKYPKEYTKNKLNIKKHIKKILNEKITNRFEIYKNLKTIFLYFIIINEKNVVVGIKRLELARAIIKYII